ncbi:hypothetical protein J1N35_030603 [Gossypium stocksii]|uniref:SCP2 domain-containing protein n=1 Tax=Gossypium stocksii TaxID=47602 RepID=A0A9D3ZT29_9ROSI|nr:hypothetical protein J1N35_030603 [Gossypium stocksii]
MANTELKSDHLFEMMKAHLASDAGKELIKKIGLVYQINIAPKKIGFDEVSYIVDLKKGEVTKGEYEGGKPDAIFSFKDDDFMKVATGKMNPQIAFMRYNSIISIYFPSNVSDFFCLGGWGFAMSWSSPVNIVILMMQGCDED